MWVFAVRRGSVVSMEVIYGFLSQIFNVVIIVKRKYIIEFFQPTLNRFSHKRMQNLNISIVIYSIQHHAFKTLSRRNPFFHNVIVGKKIDIKNKQPVLQPYFIVVLQFPIIARFEIFKNIYVFSRYDGIILTTCYIICPLS